MDKNKLDAKASMARVVVSRPVCGLCHMQVCAVKDATDEEILEVCNSKNPSGTSNGWCQVIRELKDTEFLGKVNEKLLPIQCQDFPDRMHMLVVC